MLDDFGRAPLRDKPRCFADAAASLIRQWLLRPEFRRSHVAAASPASGAPLFQTIETWKPHPVALLDGALLAMVSRRLDDSLHAHRNESPTPNPILEP